MSVQIPEFEKKVKATQASSDLMSAEEAMRLVRIAWLREQIKLIPFASARNALEVLLDLF